ncbi:hypothetical protein ACFX2F_000847 [Malus domestica]
MPLLLGSKQEADKRVSPPKLRMGFAKCPEAGLRLCAFALDKPMIGLACFSFLPGSQRLPPALHLPD